MEKFNSVNKKTVIDLIVKIIVMTFFWLFALSLLVTIVWMVIAALKTDVAYFLSSYKLSFEDGMWTLSNFSRVLEELNVKVTIGKTVIKYGPSQMLVNSILLASLMPIPGLLMNIFTSYTIANYRFKGRNFLATLAIVVFVLPIGASLGASLKLGQALGYYNNFPFYVLVQGSAFGFNYLLLLGMWKSISWSYAEAAFIDGASNFKVLTKVMLPMIMPTVVALYVLAFIGCWNDYMTPIIWLPTMPNLSMGMYSYNLKAQSMGTPENVVLAGFVLIAIPSTILFVTQKEFISTKMTIGGLKG